MFIDKARIYLKAGNGGNGAVSFHREKYVAAGGPDGGDGGKGGDVIFLVEDGIRTLADFRYKRRYLAESGRDGTGGNCTGRSAEDLVIKVAPGTIVKDAETGRILTDLTTPGQTAVIVRGGRGGKGNQHFATSTRQVPTFAKSGRPGEERWVLLELKLLADVGLVGFPNVGKSTILSMVSAAQPKIADYHFTTLEPNLGVVILDNQNSFVLADIPGLIEGAHEGIGLGHEFLRHVERTRLLIHVVDVAAIEGRDPVRDFEVINEELQQHNPALAARPQIVAANKMDIPGCEERLEALKVAAEARGCRVFPVSAASNKGLRELMYYASEQLRSLPPVVMVSEEEEEILYTPEQEVPFEIHVEDGVYVVEGNWVRHMLGSVNFDNYESMQYFQRVIKKKGVVDALEEAGIHEGDTVRMYELEFEYMK